MQLRESAIIAADAAAVWPYLADPVLQSEWNPKVISVDRAREGYVQPGERFAMIYRMNGMDRESQVEVAEVVLAKQVTYLHHLEPLSEGRMVREMYTIRRSGNGVKVTQSIDMSHLGIPWVIRLLFALVHRFGTPTDKPYLQQLKKLVEDNR